MSSLLVPPHPERNESDSDDEDYVPPPADAGSDSEDSEIAEPDAKKLKTDTTPPAQSLEERKSAWDAFQSAAAQDPPPTVEPQKMIKVLKTFRFAGRDEVKVVEVPADSEDARKWPLWQPDAPLTGTGTSTPAQEKPAAVTVSAPGSLAPSEPSGSQPTSGASTPRPGPRKRKTRLASPPRAKPRKLSTLEKSALDWQAHVASTDGLRDDLDAARRSGAGFLDKTDFLDRVGARRDDVLASASAKRKR